MILTIPGGTYQDEPRHEYRNDAGLWVPSLTQCIHLAGLSNFAGADPEDMANAARRGSELHSLVECWNRYQDFDPSWRTEELEGYFAGYLAFLGDTGFKPSPEWTERPLIVQIHGMTIGMKPDIFGKWGRDDAVIEVKAASATQASWSVQTGLQEMGIFKSNHVGRARRYALQLFNTGKYRLHAHTNHTEDELIGIAALRLTWYRINNKQKVWEMLAA